MCQPGRPGPQGLSQAGSPGLAHFHRAKSPGFSLRSSSLDAGAADGLLQPAAAQLAVVGVLGHAKVDVAVELDRRSLSSPRPG